MSDDQGHHADQDGERMELRHDAEPGYGTAYYVALALGVLYLIGVFLYAGGGAGH